MREPILSARERECVYGECEHNKEHAAAAATAITAMYRQLHSLLRSTFVRIQLNQITDANTYVYL